ncbi:MAG: hypothetical protein AB1758_17665 [Candidatus Eremiobacterota bacterium]
MDIDVGSVRAQGLVRGFTDENRRVLTRSLSEDAVSSTDNWGPTQAGQMIRHDLRQLNDEVQKEVARRQAISPALPSVSFEQASLAAGAILVAPLAGTVVFGLADSLHTAVRVPRELVGLARDVVDLVQAAPPELQALSLAVQEAARESVPEAYIPVSMFMAGANLENLQQTIDHPDRLGARPFPLHALKVGLGRPPLPVAAWQAQKYQIMGSGYGHPAHR